MLKSNLLDLIRKFSPKEIKEFGEYVRSPFFNKNSSVIKLYEFIRKSYPDFKEKKEEKQTVYKKLFPGAKYNDGHMRLIMFSLSKLAEDFLSYKNYSKHLITQKKYLLKELFVKELESNFQKHSRELSVLLGKEEQKDADHHLSLYELEYLNLSYLSIIDLHKREKFIPKSGVEDIINNLTYFFLLRVLQVYIYVLNTKNIYNIDFNIGHIENILKNFDPEAYNNVPLIKIYYYMVKLYLDENDEKYFRTLMEIIKNYETLDEMIQPEIFINLENYCKRKIRKGHEEYRKELFKIYKYELENKHYFMANKMPYELYRAIVETGLALREFHWVKNFINEYKDELSVELKENTYLNCLALYEFASENFEESLKILSKVKYDDIYQKLEIKCLYCAIYYELNLENSLLSSLDSFRHFVMNNRSIPEERKKPVTKFINYTKKLNSLKSKGDKAEMNFMAEKIKKDEIQNKDWLIKKINDMREKKSNSKYLSTGYSSL